MSIQYNDNIYNPLIPKSVITIDDDGENVNIMKSNVMKYCRELYVLVPLNQVNYMDILFTEFSKEKINDFILYKCSNRLLKSDSHYNNLLYVNQELFQTCNKFNYELNDMIFIVPIFNSTFNNIKNYIDSFDDKENLKEIYNMIILMKEFNSSNNTKNNNIIKNMILSLKESDYWTNFLNCKLNLTNEFNKRCFNIKLFRNINNQDEIKQFLQMLEKEKLDENYLEEIYKNKKYIDPSTIINKNGFKLYYMEKNTEFTNDMIHNMFECLNAENKFLMFCYLLVSKRYAHLVINNQKVLDTMKPFVLKYIELFEYLFGYAWMKLYFEESIKKSYTKTNDNFVFTAETASLLPVFPLDINNPQKNPYCPLMIANDVLQPTMNVGSMQIDWSKHNSRICNTFEFLDRFNIFCTRKTNNNLFEGIDFKEHKMGITGSAMTACMQYEHPLLKLFTTPQNTNEEKIYDRYFTEYYAESDIDVMIKTEDMFEFLDISKKVYKKVSDNIVKFNDGATLEHVKYTNLKTTYFFIDKEFIMNNIELFKLPYDIIITQLNSDTIKKILLPIIKQEHDKFYMKELEDFSEEEIENLKVLYPEYFKFDEECITIRLFDRKYKNTVENVNTNINISEEDLQHSLDTMENDDHQVNEFKFIEEDCFVKFNIKCRISSVHIDRDLEVFPIKGDDFMGVVNQFHVPCVRAYYDGTTIHMSPSFITAHLTYMNLNYKYVAGTKDPIEIINKYRMRGFGTWLNKEEVKLFIKYINKMEFWNNLYNISIDNVNTFKNAIGFLPISHKLFRPRLYNSSYYDCKNVRFILLEGDIYNEYKMKFNIPYDYYQKKYNSKINNTISIPNDYYQKKYNSKINNTIRNINFINPNSGYVNKLDKDIIQAYNYVCVIPDLSTFDYKPKLYKDCLFKVNDDKKETSTETECTTETKSNN